MAKIVETANLTWDPSNVEGIHSKSLVELPDGTAKLMRLEAGSSYPKHQHPKRTEYAFVLSGQAILTVDHEEFEAGPGNFVVFPAGTPHALANRSHQEATLLVGAVYHPDK